MIMDKEKIEEKVEQKKIKSPKKKTVKNPSPKIINDFTNTILEESKDVFLKYVETIVKAEIDQYQKFYNETKHIRDARDYLSNSVVPRLLEVYQDFVIIGHEMTGESLIYKFIKTEKDFNALKELVKKTTFQHFVEGNFI